MTPAQKNILNIAERAGVTFVEGFMATWALSNFALTKVAVYGALGTALSIVWNTSTLIKLSLIPAKEPTVVSSPPPVTQIPVKTL